MKNSQRLYANKQMHSREVTDALKDTDPTITAD